MPSIEWAYPFTMTETLFAFLLSINIYLVAISVMASSNNNNNSNSNSNSNNNQSTAVQETDNILLVIAHPDDESMFFVPTIRTLVAESKSTVHILCLSTGNFDGLGATRTQELFACAAILGIQKQHVHVVDDATLQDGKKNVWAKEDVAKQVSTQVDAWSINKIVTFDNYGVSGHENHVDTSRGVVYFYETSVWGGSGGSGGSGENSETSNGHCLYLLESTHIFRKYAGIFDVMGSLVQGGSQCFCSLTPWINYAAMQAHFSQFVWYRRLFVVFSRYTYVNNLIKQQVPKVVLQLGTKKKDIKKDR